VLAEHFPAGSGSPAVIIADASKLNAVADAIEHTNGVGNVDYLPAQQANQKYVHATSNPYTPAIIDGKVMLTAELNVSADSSQATPIIKQLRKNVSNADPSALVGGVSAIMLDSNNAATADLHKIIPIVLAVIFIILILLLRSLIAPALLIASVIVSFSATIGMSALVFNHVFNFAGSDAAIPLFAFIFLVALGVDYNIFLMTRVREEAKKIGSRAGILRGLSVTGSVITSAGIVLAATFAALAVVPILFLVQIAFIVAFGVLLDTIVVRSLLVPAISYDIGKRIWWPSRLWRKGKK
jgi:RND superfamily putative drug exporter